MIRANDRDGRCPRFGINQRAWEEIVRLAPSYQAANGAYDWPSGIEPDPRETNPRLVYARWLAPVLIAEEHSL